MVPSVSAIGGYFCSKHKCPTFLLVPHSYIPNEKCDLFLFAFALNSGCYRGTVCGSALLVPLRLANYPPMSKGRFVLATCDSNGHVEGRGIRTSVICSSSIFHPLDFCLPPLPPRNSRAVSLRWTPSLCKRPLLLHCTDICLHFYGWRR